MVINRFPHTRKNAFSLVELSIVLVILGLLVGGVLSGQSLIRAAELRSYAAESERIRAAMHSFRDKYFSLPGDMTNATQFWGVAAGTGNDATCENTESTDNRTCNGNGDGYVGTNQVNEGERFRFWQQLAAAGLIEGRYTGRTDSATSGSFVLTAGKNVPNLKGSATFTVVAKADSLGSAFMFNGTPSGNYLEFRNSAAGSSSQPLAPAEQWNLDSKLDDGRPGYGVLTGPISTWNGVGATCTSTTDPSTANYNLNVPDKVCRFNLLVL